MTPDQWDQVARLFDEAVGFPTADRAVFVREITGRDPEIGAELQRLLQQHDALGDFLENPFEVMQDLARLPVWGLLEPGDEVADRFRIVRFIASGGMGEVYDAFDRNLGKHVALKTVSGELAGDPAVIEQFRREVELAQRVTHPNVCRVHDLFLAGGLSPMFLTMELIAGVTLAERLRDGGPIKPKEALSLLRQVALAIEALHANEVIHRDLKSPNILLEPLRNAEIRVKVTDFGIASPSLLKHSALAAGSPAYMAPEQREGRDPTPACDIYSLGVVAHEMVTGTPPDQGIVRRHPNLPRQWERAIARCLRSDPSERFPDARSFVEALGGSERFLGRRNMTLLLSGAAISGIGWFVQNPAKLGTGASGGALSLAVVPFDAEDAALQPLARGIAGDIIRALSASPLLRVSGEASSRAAIAQSNSLPTVGRELNVEHVLTGRVRRQSDGVAVEVQIRRAVRESVEWEETLVEPSTHVARLAPRIARSIAGAMHVELRTLGAVALAPQIVGSDAYEQYLLGRAAALDRSEASLEESIRRYQAALALAPAFAPAYAAMALSYNILAGNSRHPLLPTFQLGEDAARRALSLDPAAGEAHLALASITQRRDWDWAVSERHYRAAMTFSPGAAVVHQWFSGLLSILRRPEEAVVEAERACALEPLALPPKAALSGMLFRARRYPEAVRQLKLILQIKRDYQPAWDGLGSAWRQLGNHAEALHAHLEAVRLSNQAPAYLASLGDLYAVTGRRADALAILNSLERRWPGEQFYPWSLVQVNRGLGEMDQAFRWMEVALKQRDPNLTILVADPSNDILRSDPRFPRFVRELKL